MQIHDLKRTHKSIVRLRVGRGGKKGTYSGKGMKGQNSRAGRKFMPAIRELIKRYPKLKGYKAIRFPNLEAVLDLNTLEKRFEDSATVNPKTLVEMKIIRRIKGRVPQVKILGAGELTKKLAIEGCSVSESAKAKIEKAKGTIK